MKFTIVTPCLNPGPRLRDTVDSVLGQRALLDGRVDLEYMVCDGGSSDGSLAYAMEQADAGVRVSSVKDGGMYEAVARGLQLTDGDVVAYLNAGDIYHPTAFDVVRELMMRPSVHWLTGCAVEMSDTLTPVGFMQPFRYRQRLLEHGAYGTILPFVPQESTFWRRSLHDTIDFGRLQRYRLAGDYYLWLCFSRATTLYVASAFLGAFRRHPEQLSTDRAAYLEEVRSMTKPLTLIDRATCLVDRLLWYAPRRVKKRLNRRYFFQFDHSLHRWV